jgi:ApaG protein
MSDVTTRGIRIQVESRFVPEHSHPHAGQSIFLYTVRITNEGESTVQLISRHWIITDAHGKVEEVKGPGVVGEQPVLEPGETFEYTSMCPLETPYGTMEGTYQMQGPGEETFDAVIAPFFLSEPHSIN